MNVLSVILNKAASDLKVKYHHRCSSSKLTHVCFADDLLIFIDGSLSLVQNVLQVLTEFELRSGLAELDTIKASTGMHQGSLHVCYLGIPMCTKKLSLQNCEVLLHQIKGKFSSWSVRSLSFAGRLLLIKTVFAGINNFWCFTFLLPKECIKRMNSLCGMFLWNGNIEGSHTAQVSWEVVTKTKEQGA
ncbi:hypothetical protein Bca52824_087340 [Brassica carinata]|uniref:Reverse transcriptase domain-containing protein n=1 Tax=Brassica carinata TaxID=52824 RepID=A0A8X7TMV3_BRACI|nr:hypothetical protein Bca52824_087340 [Brassica carinata]